MCTSYCLYKNDKPKLRGSITLQLSIGAGAAVKNFNNITHSDRKSLLRIILQHELKISKMASHCWLGQFSDLGDAIIAHSGHKINAQAHTLAQWSEFTAFHTMHPLSFELFENLLMVWLPFLKSHKTTVTPDEMDIFWDGVKKLLPSCFAAFRCSSQKSDIDMEMITGSLSILSTINTLKPPKDIELFPKKIYGWLDETIGNISNAVEESIRSRAQDYLFGITEFQFVHQENIESNLKNIMKVMESIEIDLQQAKDVYNKLFTV